MKIMYIDAQNVHKSIEELGRIIDRGRFFNYSKEKFELDSIKIFFGYVKRYETLYNQLKNDGYEVVFKETLVLPDGTIKGNVDIDIAISSILDMCEGGLDKFYLVSGDGDYNTLVNLCKDRNIFARVLIPNREKASQLLKKAAGSNIQPLEDLKFLIEKKNPDTKGEQDSS